ncbi:MAG: Hpt domain-containing protein [Alphaproteobacteria bacterium]|nr:MAG: Hpt domain-containing protein [Alphaproteobacteria bacterium]
MDIPEPIVPLESLDLTNLSDVFGEDREGARLLVDTLITSTQESLTTLTAECTDGANETWRKTAHAIKGEMANLGAARLSELCQKAQHAHEASASEKRAYLQAIEQEWTVVQTGLSQML